MYSYSGFISSIEFEYHNTVSDLTTDSSECKVAHNKKEMMSTIELVTYEAK